MVGAVSLSDILVTPTSKITVVGGDVLHAMKDGDAGFSGFGEAYFSTVNVNAIKSWKRHIRMTMNLLVPIGSVRFVFYLKDTSGVDHFRIEDIGQDRYARITVPPGIWFGFKGIANAKNLILNIANIPHDPLEIERLDSSEINYQW